jgi:SAM-dependent methyltransferase
VPFHATFSCLWCGTSYVPRSPDDLEGWAQLCPECVGKAGDNGFLRFRLRQALSERSASASAKAATSAGPPAKTGPRAKAGPPAKAGAPAKPGALAKAGAHPVPGAGTAGSPAPGRHAAGAVPTDDPDRDMAAYYEARAPEYDDWYLRRGRYSHGAIDDAVWNVELDAAGQWLDALPWSGEIVELAAGTGWWSPLLASRGELSLYDTSPAALDRARDRLVAHGLRAHLHVRDAWAEPDRPVDGLFMGFWLSHVPHDRLAEFLRIARRWLRSGGRLAFIDSLADPASGATDHPAPADDRSVRRLADGREFTIVKVYRHPDQLADALRDAGFRDVDIRTTGRFFTLGSALAG